MMFFQQTVEQAFLGRAPHLLEVEWLEMTKTTFDGCLINQNRRGPSAVH